MLEARAWLNKPLHVRFFSLLSFFVCLDALGNVCLLVYAWTNILGGLDHSVEVFDPKTPGRAFSALGSLCTWIGLVRYFGHSRRLTLVTTTLQFVAQPIIWTLASVLPVVLGFALTGIQLFGEYAPGFTTLPIALSTLWALMIGDEINSTFRQLTPVYPILGRLYIFTFVGIFYLAVANIFVVLIESAYMLALQQHYKSKGEGSSKTQWSNLGAQFARYAQKLVNLSTAPSSSPPTAPPGGEPPPSQGHEALARRLDALEQKLERQTELLERLLSASPMGAVGLTAGVAGGAAGGTPKAPS